MACMDIGQCLQILNESGQITAFAFLISEANLIAVLVTWAAAENMIDSRSNVLKVYLKGVGPP